MEKKPKSAALDDAGILDALNASIQQLQQGFDMHCCLVNAIAEQQTDTTRLASLMRDCPSRSREAVLRAALKETIHVLEESRKAFKSKRLEALRKHLTDVLIQTN